MYKIVLSFVLFFFSVQFVDAQLVVDSKSPLNTNDTVSIVQQKLHSPHKATLYEAIVPGLGHIYNKKYWNLPFTYAGFGITIFFIADNTKKYKKYRDAYADFSKYRKYLIARPEFPLPESPPEQQRFRELRDADFEKYTPAQLESFNTALRNGKDAFKRYRDLSYISLGAVYVLNVIWATVDAHFFYYDVSEDLSLQIQPQLIITDDYRQGLGVGLVLRF